MADRGHLELCPLAQNAGVFGRDVKAKSFIKGLKKSNQSSKHPSRRLVTELRILTLLKGQYFGPPFLRSYITDDAQTSLG